MRSTSPGCLGIMIGVIKGVCSRIFTSGAHVGLPDGQMGNSEVGHVNIGAGRVVKQTLVRISSAVAQNQLPHHPHVRLRSENLSRAAASIWWGW